MIHKNKWIKNGVVKVDRSKMTSTRVTLSVLLTLYWGLSYNFATHIVRVHTSKYIIE